MLCKHVDQSNYKKRKYINAFNLIYPFFYFSKKKLCGIIIVFAQSTGEGGFVNKKINKKKVLHSYIIQETSARLMFLSAYWEVLYFANGDTLWKKKTDLLLEKEINTLSETGVMSCDDWLFCLYKVSCKVYRDRIICSVSSMYIVNAPQQTDPTLPQNPQ